MRVLREAWTRILTCTRTERPPRQHSVLLCNLFYVRFKRRLETTTRRRRFHRCVFIIASHFSVYGKEIVAIIFAKFQESIPEDLLKLEEEEEKKNFKLKKYRNSNNNKLEERVVSRRVWFFLQVALASLGSHRRDLNWNYSLDDANYFHYERGVARLSWRSRRI